MKYRSALISLFFVFLSPLSGAQELSCLDSWPQFKALGQSYYISTGCSPHSRGYQLDLAASVLTLRATGSAGKLEVWQLNFPCLDIAWTRHQDTPPYTTSLQLMPSDQRYQELYDAFFTGVKALRFGNGTCFKEQADLEDLYQFLLKNQKEAAW